MYRDDWIADAAVCSESTPLTLSLSSGSNGVWHSSFTNVLNPKALRTISVHRAPSPIGRVVLLTDAATRALFRDTSFLPRETTATSVDNTLLVPLVLWLPCGEDGGAANSTAVRGAVHLNLFDAMHSVNGTGVGFVGTPEYTTFLDATDAFVTEVAASSPRAPSLTAITGVLGERLGSLPAVSSITFKESECGPHARARKLVFVQIRVPPNAMSANDTSMRAWFSPLTAGAINGRQCGILGSSDSGFAATRDDDGTSPLSTMVQSQLANERPRASFAILNTYSTGWLAAVEQGTDAALPPLAAFFGDVDLVANDTEVVMAVGVPLITAESGDRKLYVVVTIGAGLPDSAFDDADEPAEDGMGGVCSTVTHAELTGRARATALGGAVLPSDVVDTLVGTRTSYPTSAAVLIDEAAAWPNEFTLYPSGVDSDVFGALRVVAAGDEAACVPAAEGIDGPVTHCVVYDLHVSLARAMQCLNYDGSAAVSSTTNRTGSPGAVTAIALPITVTWYAAAIDASGTFEDTFPKHLVTVYNVSRTIVARVTPGLGTQGDVPPAIWSSPFVAEAPVDVTLVSAVKESCDAFECDPSADSPLFQCDCGAGSCPEGTSYAQYSIVLQVVTTPVDGHPDVGVLDSGAPSRPLMCAPYGLKLTTGGWAVSFAAVNGLNVFTLRYTTSCRAELNVTSAENSRFAFRDPSTDCPTGFGVTWPLATAPRDTPHWSDVAAALAIRGAPEMLPGMTVEPFTVHVRASLSAPVFPLTLQRAGQPGGFAVLAPLTIYPWPSSSDVAVEALQNNETLSDFILAVRIADPVARSFLSLFIYSAVACVVNPLSPYTDCVMYGGVRENSTDQLDCPSPALAYLCDVAAWNASVNDPALSPIVAAVPLVSAFVPVTSAGTTRNHQCRASFFDEDTAPPAGADEYLCPTEREASFCGAPTNNSDRVPFTKLVGVNGSEPGLDLLHVSITKVPAGRVVFLVTAVAADCDDLLLAPSPGPSPGPGPGPGPGRRLVQYVQLLLDSNSMSNGTANTRSSSSLSLLIVNDEDGRISDTTTGQSALTDFLLIFMFVALGVLLIAAVAWFPCCGGGAAGDARRHKEEDDEAEDGQGFDMKPANMNAGGFTAIPVTVVARPVEPRPALFLTTRSQTGSQRAGYGLVRSGNH